MKYQKKNALILYFFKNLNIWFLTLQSSHKNMILKWEKLRVYIFENKKDKIYQFTTKKIKNKEELDCK